MELQLIGYKGVKRHKELMDRLLDKRQLSVY